MEKVLFWDFDGTLVFPDSKWSTALYVALHNLSYNVSFDDIRHHLHTGYTWHTPEIDYVESTGQKWWDKLFHHFSSLYKEHEISEIESTRINRRFKEQILDSSNYTLYEDAIFVLQSCLDLGCQNYILSNNFPELPFVIEGLGLSKFFAGYVVSGNLGYEKPRKEIFQYALRISGFPDDCFMIGDNPVADMQGGRTVGMKTILVHKECVFDADYTCNDLIEIPSILSKDTNKGK